MINFSRLNNIKYIRAKEQAYIIARRTATARQQVIINLELSIIYNAKYKLLGE